MLADPLCRLDFCLETDGAVAFVVTSGERARDLRSAAGTHRCQRSLWLARLGQSFLLVQHAGSGIYLCGRRACCAASLRSSRCNSKDIDVALIYDHFSPLVIMQLEDYGFCARGEGGPFVESGADPTKRRHSVNPHGGHLSEAYGDRHDAHSRSSRAITPGRPSTRSKTQNFALVTGGPPHSDERAILRR